MCTSLALQLFVNNDVGLHARPATVFVQTALQFASKIKVSHDGREADGKSLLGLLALGVGKGSSITVEAQGEDANQALEAIKALVESDFEKTTPNNFVGG